ncbi:hypothetical protein [uncultured Draconibacterium sp.]|uniref:hypothetical protein n=1 Tax=uncultured Draconibacterium sp. TaxID=1573823 RepID=UPI003216B22C
MSNQTKHIESSFIELKTINSNAYYIVKIIGFVMGTIAALIGGAILSRGQSEPFISRWIELPLWLTLILVVLVFIMIIIASFLQCNKYSNSGMLYLHENKIEIENKNFPIENKSIKFYFNSLKHKSNYKRDFMEGCNNWIEFENNGKTIKKEFKIESKTHDDNILNQITKWQHLGIDVKIKEKRRNFWQMWNDF